MPRRPRLSTGGIAYHVLNRRVGRLELFEKPADYFSFEKILAEAHDRTGIRIAAYCLMAEPLASFIVAAHRRRAIRSYAMDHGHAFAALACAPAFIWDWSGVSGAIQIFSGADRRAFSCSGEICRTQCSTGEIGRASRRVAMVKHLSDCPTGREAC